MNTTFASLGLNDKLQDVTEKLYFKTPTEIQQKTIPKILKGESIIGQSQTGSGKTHAYLLPLLNQIDEAKQHVQVVITTPTRELAIQIHEEIKTIIELLQKQHHLRARLLVGGLDRERMIKQLKNTPQIIIGTPGRVFDMVNEGVISIYQADSFIIDEADLMVELGFIDTIDQLLVRSREDIQMLVFSATIPQALQIFLTKYLQQPSYVKIDSDITPNVMTHQLIPLKHENPVDKILELAKHIQPYVALLFVNSKEKADTLGQKLQQSGLNIGILHGGLSMRERTRVVKDLLDLKYQYIVATDLASRGIDIKGTSHVINVELPKQVDFYIHRVGRTARAGLSGTAISFYVDTDIALISELEKKGMTFQYVDIKNGELVESKHFDQRVKRKNVKSNLDKEAWKRVKKPKRVKPGYKKKMKQQQEKVKRRLKKQRFGKK